MSNIRRYLLLSAVLCFSSLAIAQKTDSKAPETPAQKDQPAADYSKEAYVVEHWTNSYYFENDGTGRLVRYAKIKVQSEAGVQAWGRVVVGYNSGNERVDISYVRVLKADGTTVTAPADAIQDINAPVADEAPVYTDFKQKHVTVPSLRPGDTLEYEVVTVTQTPLAPKQFWMAHDFAEFGIILDEQLEVNVPADRVVKLKTKPGLDPKITEESGRRIYRWTSSHLTRDDDDADKKDKEKEKAKKKKRNKPEPPAVQMTTFPSWEEVGKWYAGLERDRREPTPEIRAKATELTAGKKTDIEKIEALYDYVAMNFRYISLSFGVGRYQPHAAAEILHNEYGDCKDKHTLLASLLKAVGYNASSVLINSSRKLDPDVPSPLQFDHVITLLPLGKEEVWMDTTAEVAPFRLLSPAIRKKQALVIPQNGVPHLEETPPNPPMQGMTFQDVDGKVSPFGKLDAHIKYALRGDAELYMRQWFRRIPNAKWQQLVKNMTAAGGLDGEITNLTVGDPADTHKAFQVEFQIAAANFFDWSKKKFDLSLPLSQVGLPDADEDENGPDSDPIQIGAPAEYDFRVRLEFPAKFTVRVPLPFSMKRDYAQFSASYQMDGNVFTAERKLTVGVREVVATRVSDYLAFRRALLADSGQHLSVDSTAAGNPTAPTDLKGDELNDAANAALTRGNYEIAIDLFKRVVEAEPKHKSAWINLGRAYMALHKTDDAAQAFRKHTEANPYDEYGYSSLGWAYSTARKYDESIAAYEKAIEINPLSQFAHSALGGVYSEQHKYDKAAPELEKAVSLQPDEAFLQISLGDAYLNLGQDDKALAAFDRAIEISANPEIWNDIAYQLSLKKSHLDRAQQYAESAVTSVSTALRNTTIDQLTDRDLPLVSSLSAYWDTLGWVYFAKDDFVKAEKYILPAWVLDQRSEVGDHLGQIYEKSGRKEDAIRVYALALLSIRPMPETRPRLAALVGGDGKVDKVVAKYKDELQAVNTIKLGKIAKDTGSADFFVLIAGANVEGVKFVSGDEKLKVFTEALRTAKYNFNFPDGTPAKVLRRGTLTCSKETGECNFVMVLPEDVRSVN